MRYEWYNSSAMFNEMVDILLVKTVMFLGKKNFQIVFIFIF